MTLSAIPRQQTNLPNRVAALGRFVRRPPFVAIGWPMACLRGRASYKPKRLLPTTNDSYSAIEPRKLDSIMRPLAIRRHTLHIGRSDWFVAGQQRLGCRPPRTAGGRNPRSCNWTAVLRALVGDRLRCTAAGQPLASVHGEISRLAVARPGPTAW